MKPLLFLLLLAAGTLISAHSNKRLPKAVPGTVATCVGDSPCRACKNCKYCKRCAKDGKICGVCKK